MSGLSSRSSARPFDDANESAQSRKRIKLACQACQKKRSKCDGAQPQCESCKSQNRVCDYVQSGNKRGPTAGSKFKPRKPRTNGTAPLIDSNNPERDAVSSQRNSPGTSSPAVPVEDAGPAQPEAEAVAGITGLSLLGQDYLLTIYWTHIHNLWPIIYKPSFLISSTHPALLYSMLAISSVITVPVTAHTPCVPAATLFFSAALEQIHVLEQQRTSQIVLCQVYILMSARQSRVGDKSGAYLWSVRAAGLCLELGLHRRATASTHTLTTGKKPSSSEEEIRSRIWWSCYLLDKILAEEMGRPVLLHARKTTTPLPSVNEADEYELWPPPSSSTFLNPGVIESSTTAQNYLEPTQGRIISSFNTVCHLGIIIEKILDLDEEGPRLYRIADGGRDDDQDYQAQGLERTLKAKEILAGDLDAWIKALPPDLYVDASIPRPAPTHLIVSLAWYHSAVLLLHSRFICLSPRPDLDTGQSSTGLYGESHMHCTNSAEQIVALVQILERNKLLAQITSDVIPILSQAALFHAHNSALADVAMANRAKLNFSLCCLWMRDLSRYWPPASAHKIFFEGLIQGGLEMSETSTTQAHVRSMAKVGEGPAKDQPSYSPPSPRLANSDFGNKDFPSIGFSGNMEPLFSDVPQADASNAISIPPLTNWPTDLFQLPSMFWNDALPTSIAENMLESTLSRPFPYASDVYTRDSTVSTGETQQLDMAPSNAGVTDDARTARESDQGNGLINWMLEALLNNPQFDSRQR